MHETASLQDGDRAQRGSTRSSASTGDSRASEHTPALPWIEACRRSVDAETVCDAMIAADAYGRAFREAARAREYTNRASAGAGR
jgi:hypothetical protein